jgi:ribosome-binding factor A
VGRRTGVRFTPTLEFVADAIPENAANIDDLLRTARESDERVAQVAADAEYAGDPDPYRKPADEDEDDELDDDAADDPDDEAADAAGEAGDDTRG